MCASVVWIMSVIPGGLQGRSPATERDAVSGNRRKTLSLLPFIFLLTLCFKRRKKKESALPCSFPVFNSQTSFDAFQVNQMSFPVSLYLTELAVCEGFGMRLNYF
ncbi:hypothetical protein ILYODFUR_033875 [Ilyodon furcidens]|uniref:Secreted protein n=1 Tax=Ilyodon furcidens TaxID=33524 RepID=A0ABV0UXE9_9TELE